MHGRLSYNFFALEYPVQFQCYCNFLCKKKMENLFSHDIRRIVDPMTNLIETC